MDPTEIEVMFPSNSGMSLPVDIIESSPYRIKEDISHKEMPLANPLRHPAMAPDLFVFFHITDSKIGVTEEPIQIPIVR